MLRIRGALGGRVGLVAWSTLIAGGWLLAGAVQADPFVPMNAVYKFNDSGRGGAYLPYGPGFSWLYVAPGGRAGPYGGWYDGDFHQFANLRYPGHPGYNYTFQNGIADIPAFIFDVEPGGYTPDTFPYPRLELSPYNTQASPDINAIPKSTDVGGFPGAILPAVDFLSLPGNDLNPSNPSYVVVGTQGKVIDPNGPGADILIQQLYQSLDGVEEARLYVSTRVVADASTLTDADFQFAMLLTPGSGTVNPTKDYLTDYYIDLASLGVAWQVQAIKIEGMDFGGTSPGFDLASVLVSPTSLADNLAIPEPTSLVLLSLGGLAAAGLAGLRRARRTRV